MKKVTVANFRNDKLFPRIERAVGQILSLSEFVEPIEVFVGMGLLKSEQIQDWRFGRIPYLEKAVGCNLSKISRTLRILRFHVHDLNLRPSYTAYMMWGKGKKVPLRFSKTADEGVERAWATRFLTPGHKSKKDRSAHG